jgi:alkaline phosphatase D
MSRCQRSFIYPAVVCVIASCVSCWGAVQYKKISREAVSDIVDGKYDVTIRETQDYLRDQPGDLESMYVMAMAHARKGQIEEALSYVRKALAGGLPFERFQAGPRDLLGPLTESAAFKELAERHGSTLLHGPMVGDVTDRRISVWVRTAREAPVRVNLFLPGETGRPVRTAVAETHRRTDFTAVLDVDGLEPDTLYEYVVQAGEEAAMWKGRVRTFPTRGEPARFTIGFGGGAGYTPQHERMWNTTRSRDLTAFLFLGDNVYIDNPTRRAVQQYCYYRRQSRPEYRRFVAGTPIFAIWDDHDFTTDDGWGGPQIDEPEWKVPVWHTFRHNWVNPYYGRGESQPGCWFHFSIADVDFFMLDGRYYRVKGRRQGVEVDDPSMLGAAQKKWLFDRLAASKGTFKVIASPVPWSFGAKPGRGGMDTWEGFHEEREEIFSFLERDRIDGVILISADRHRSDAWKNERENGYPLYEFESSRLTNIHTHPVMPGSLFGYNEKCSFGLIAFDTTAPDPTVTYRVVNIDNEDIHALVLKKSELTHRQ